MCFIPLPSMKSANSRDTNWGPLSFTTCSGKPNAENTRLRVAMVFCQPLWKSFLRSLATWNERSSTIQTSSHGRTSKVHVDSLPRKFRPPPRVQWWLAGCTLHCLAGSTCLGKCLNVCVYSRPPHHTASKRLHSHHSSMAAMQDFQESLLQLPRNHHPNSPKQTLTL